MASAITYVGPWRVPVILASASRTPDIPCTRPSASSIERHIAIRPPHSPMMAFPSAAAEARPSVKSRFSEISLAWSSGYPPPR